ncbi:ATP synthase epsilon chain [[Clostridium] ultunense Esp]|uniref:F0F1 ATP synthase subunit epsilon n=1 Tax=Thermicanus aegyptius TaxID=94009 RepID=UPI0002B6EF31|nr:F0F1 ATP synthase subunit epsilon [Thermicanus aegyptius]CCQ94966.1 ATP synthase epsilon chain [[Clostridium] ultunense Esp]
MTPYLLEIVTPERLVFSGQVTFVSVMAAEGAMGIAAHHMPLVTTLQIAPVKIQFPDAKEELVAVSGGFIEIHGTKVTILAETAELPEEIDIDRAFRAKERAEQRLADRSEYDFKRAELALRRALTRIEVGRSRE